ncbi:serine protease gd [Monomorium pharaonis]|uniref:serine protease gd n=1 Tax=Monomorium pharaonis TaxID=307658 RepID=UPI0017469E8A|nr:serine protease gd [Monomorium pharaonis]XP_012521479.2 serine protease gd [Monomorium pharaonis]XP_012521481.2 serine protease gd [Monomorium pharaonis]XP_012521482.2 serine protease gd [Monomorium pharaonis]XP_036139311.1 serine protease gd [Monomorium pharaonis]
MAKISVLISLLLCLLCTKTVILVQGQLSNCSEYFTYMTKPETMSGLLGQIEIPTPPENDDFYLKVALNVASESSKKFFRLELVRPIKESVQAVQQGNSLFYYIYFLSQPGEPNPTLSAIWFNDRQYCPESRGNIRATLVLAHIVYLSNEEPLSWRRNSSNYRKNNPSHEYLNYLSHSKPITATPSDGDNECGTTNYYTDDTNMLLSDGEKALPGQWPWVVTIFVVTTSYEFQCVGSVLTTSHVITTAYCLKLNSSGNDTIDPNNLFVAFGKLNSRQWRERGTITRDVASYKIHPDYAHTDIADFDLAILTLRIPVTYSPFIKPICLWFGPTNLQNVIDKTGYVVGWGQNFSGNFGQYTEEPRMTRVPIVSQEDCRRNDPGFVRLISNRTFCAGSRYESNLCNIDYGSGLMLFDSISGRYQLRGMASRTVTNLARRCPLGKFIVYVDVAKYIPWIRQQISTIVKCANT